MVCVGDYHDQTSGFSGRRAPVPVRILPPVETRGLTSDDLPQLMEQCRQQMAEAIAGLARTPGSA